MAAKVPQPPPKDAPKFDHWAYLLWRATVGDVYVGSVNFAAAATNNVVTSPKVTANSVIVATVATNDATLKSVQAVAAATSETRVNFIVTN